MRETIDTTYADLRPTDLVIDKSGFSWKLADLSTLAVLGEPAGDITFWLLDPKTETRLHYLSRPANDAVKVSRLPTQADEAAKLEADFSKPPTIDFNFNEVAEEMVANVEKYGIAAAEKIGVGATMAEAVATTSTETVSTIETAGVAAELTEAGVEEADMATAVAGVEALLGGIVEAEVTAEEVDTAAAATDDLPVSLPPFADMTPLEQRSHLYLLHGLYGSDVTGKAELIAIHDQAHTQHDAGALQSRHVPHVHTRKFDGSVYSDIGVA